MLTFFNIAFQSKFKKQLEKNLESGKASIPKRWDLWFRKQNI